MIRHLADICKVDVQLESRVLTVPVLYRCGYFVSFWAILAFLESVSYTFHEAYENRGSSPCRGANSLVSAS
jgi:hypothetical protein